MLGQRLRRWSNIEPTLSWQILAETLEQCWLIVQKSRLWCWPNIKPTLTSSQGDTANTQLIAADIIRWPDAGSLLGRRGRRWANSDPTMDQRLMSAGVWGGGGVYIDSDCANEEGECVFSQKFSYAICHRPSSLMEVIRWVTTARTPCKNYSWHEFKEDHLTGLHPELWLYTLQCKGKQQQLHAYSEVWLCRSDSSIGSWMLNPVLLNCLFLFFIHLKLELLRQFPASNDEKFVYF